MSRGAKNGNVLGIALTPASISAAAASVPTVWSAELDLKGGVNGAREALAEALAEALTEAARASGMGEPTIVVALLPPLAETRTISLPPMRRADRDQFLSRNAGKYFLGAAGAQVVGTHSGPSQSRRMAAGPVLAAAATRTLMQAVHAASATAGCAVRGVVPAEAAWAAAAVEMWPVLARGSGHAIVARDDRCDMLTLRGGALESVRRFRGPADAQQIASLVADGDRGSAPVALMGPSDAVRELGAALGGIGVRVLVPEPKWLELSERPEALAARFAAAATGLELRSEESRVMERGSIRRAAWWIYGVAAATVVIATLVHFAGVRRELASVEAERAAIRGQVDASLVGRSTVDATYRQVAGLSSAARNSPRWSEVLATLTAHLPVDASLTAFRARGDSIFIDGVADQAAPVFDAISRMPGISGVTATAPVRRDAIEGEVPLEHFSLGAKVSVVRP